MLLDITYRERRLLVWPNRDVFDDEFRHQVAVWQERDEDETGRESYLQYKEKKVAEIMALSNAELLRTEWVEVI